MDTTNKVIIFILFAFTGFTAGLIGHDVGQRNVREQAVVRGHAQWKVDDKGQNVTFEWKK